MNRMFWSKKTWGLLPFSRTPSLHPVLLRIENTTDVAFIGCTQEGLLAISLVSALSSIPEISGWWRVIPNLDRYSTRMEPPKKRHISIWRICSVQQMPCSVDSRISQTIETGTMSLPTVPALQPGRSQDPEAMKPNSDSQRDTVEWLQKWRTRVGNSLKLKSSHHFTPRIHLICIKWSFILLCPIWRSDLVLFFGQNVVDFLDLTSHRHDIFHRMAPSFAAPHDPWWPSDSCNGDQRQLSHTDLFSTPMNSEPRADSHKKFERQAT